MKTCLVLLVMLGTSGNAQTLGTFAATSSMTTPRDQHTATLLTNGKVLIVGGENSSSYALASAELYDPAIASIPFGVPTTGVFSATGALSSARRLHSATLLPDGRVLITGGYALGGVVVSSAELYDPSTGTFTATRGTSTVTVGGIATLLKNGKVLITGNTPELYDPVTDSFAPAGFYVGPFYAGPFYPDTATLLQDGRVLIAGSSGGDCWLEHEEVYDPVTGTFKVVGTLYPYSGGCAGYIGSEHTATLLQNGKVLLAGGVNDEPDYFSHAEL
jgi:hypothetical protein